MLLCTMSTLNSMDGLEVKKIKTLTDWNRLPVYTCNNFETKNEKTKNPKRQNKVEKKSFKTQQKLLLW